MAVQYRRNLTVPEGFPSILKSFTRETLRNQPADLYEFSAAYFAQQLQQARSQEVQVEGPSQSTEADRKILGTGLTSLYDHLFSRFQQQAAKTPGVTALEAREILAEVWALHGLPRVSADAAIGLAQMDAQGCVEINNLANSTSQQLYEMLSESFAPIRDDALTAYAMSPLAGLVCNVAPDDLQEILQAALDAACGGVLQKL
ncbi:hypothetical protein WJX84_003957 [Apatococcus fuscideae]|uniref:RIIa domain-containing protein n=1 Tax=Apatococcus fuscideae TaxID=2026836 RepID=A0AAW1SSD6_9CHLO